MHLLIPTFRPWLCRNEGFVPSITHNMNCDSVNEAIILAWNSQNSCREEWKLYDIIEKTIVRSRFNDPSIPHLETAMEDSDVGAVLLEVDWLTDA